MIVTFEIWDISTSIYEVNPEASIFLEIYYVLDIVIEMSLLYLFAIKLYKINVLQCKLYDSDHQMSTERKYMSQVMIDSATRQSFLAICAIAFDSMYSGVALVRNVLGTRNDASLNVYVVVWYIAITQGWVVKQKINQTKECFFFT